MMPLGDDNSDRKSFPLITYTLIMVNTLIFLLELSGGEEFIMNWSFVPSRFKVNPAANFATLFTAMFMHAGWFHLFGNMLYLGIFGGNVEDRLGKVKYILFYLICGIAASFAQYAIDPNSTLPNLGASGAIAGVLGAYILFFPKEKIKVLLGNMITELPALIVIGFWFAFQFFSGLGSLASTEDQGGGVAYMAHVGGFVTGFLIAVLLKAVHSNK